MSSTTSITGSGDNPYCGQAKAGYRMYCHPEMFDGVADRLYRNNGDRTFTDISKQAGIANPAGKGLGVAFCDFDRDGKTDIYVANDSVRNFLYRNNGDGTFVDVAYGAGVGYDEHGKAQAGMGTDCADVDGDGLPDIFVTNYSEELNTLYQNRGQGVFEDVTVAAGLGSGFLPLGFGTAMYDADNDGDLDIHVTNGHVIDNVNLYRPTLSYAQKDLLYENLAAAGTVPRRVRARRSRSAGDARRPRPRGRRFRQRRPSRRRDYFPEPARGAVAKPGARTGNWITIRAKGNKSNALPWAPPSRSRRVKAARCGRSTTSRVISAATTSGCMSAWARRRSFGESRSLWPSGTRQVLKDVAVNPVLVIDEP